jgi:hypothetical protein
MLTKINESGKKISENEIVVIENCIKHKLPDDYRNFLLKHNGGRPEPFIFKVDKFNEGESSVHTFLGIDREIESDNLLWSYKTLKNRLPNTFLSVGYSDSDDQICLDLSEKNYGKVYLWDYYSECGKDCFDNVYYIAPSFKEFLAMMMG